MGNYINYIDHTITILIENPKEEVISEDSYAQLNTKLTLEWNNCLLKARKTEKCLTKNKLKNLLEAYKDYQNNNKLLEERIVHMKFSEILSLNTELEELITN